MKIDIYIDGSSRNNQKKDLRCGGYGIYIESESGCEFKYGSGEIENVTNSDMEVLALLKALRYIKYIVNMLKDDITIYTDSNYVYNTINKRWLWDWAANEWKNKSKVQVSQYEYWKDIYDNYATAFNFIKVEKVLGHSGNKGNEIVDELAKSKQRIGIHPDDLILATDGEWDESINR